MILSKLLSHRERQMTRQKAMTRTARREEKEMFNTKRRNEGNQLHSNVINEENFLLQQFDLITKYQGFPPAVPITLSPSISARRDNEEII